VGRHAEILSRDLPNRNQECHPNESHFLSVWGCSSNSILRLIQRKQKYISDYYNKFHIKYPSTVSMTKLWQTLFYHDAPDLCLGRSSVRIQVGVTNIPPEVLLSFPYSKCRYNVLKEAMQLLYTFRKLVLIVHPTFWHYVTWAAISLNK
jgi:hypothetical protein